MVPAAPLVVKHAATRDSQRVHRPPKRLGIDKANITSHEETEPEHCAYVTISECDPVNMREVCESPDCDKWMDAAPDEYKSLMEQKTWELGPVPEGRFIVGSRWVFKRKLDEQGHMSCYKARHAFWIHPYPPGLLHSPEDGSPPDGHQEGFL